VPVSAKGSSPRRWGPSHQHVPPPRPSRGRHLAIAIALLVIVFELTSRRLLSEGLLGALASTLQTLLHAGLVIACLWLGASLAPRLLALRRARRARTAVGLDEHLAGEPDPTHAVRARSLVHGGGAFLGQSATGRWVASHPEHAVLVLGPPRSGKTSAVVIPALLASPGAVVCTSTKPDVMHATAGARTTIGQVWLFDPTGEHDLLPAGARRLHWSPVAAADSWDRALHLARAMTAATFSGAGTTNESHWRERSAALLAPLLLAANLGRHNVGDVLRWVLRGELDPPAQNLTDHDQTVAGDVLAGIARTDSRERSSILSATAGALAAYNADATRRAASRPNFDPDRFAAGTDTIYITAPAHAQAQCAPLVVGLLEQIRHATYARRRSADPAGPPLLMCLDELANIAPIHDLPALVSEAGGQGLHVLACLQDLSQARGRWGEAADGFLSLFQTKLILDGIADSKTLEAISLMLGEYDRHVVSETTGRTHVDRFFSRQPPTQSDSFSYSTVRQRVLSPGEIASLPEGQGLLLRGTRWELLRLTPWHSNEPWRTLAALTAPVLHPAPARAPTQHRQ
jgi:type IV secretory pathway TraG/TraD family ATPase VirD4